MSAKKKTAKTKTKAKSKELTKAQLAKLPIKELRKHGLQPTPFSLGKLFRFFFNKKTYTYPFVSLATGFALNYFFAFPFWPVTAVTALLLYALRFIDNHCDQDYDIIHKKELFCRKDNIIMMFVFITAFIVTNVALYGPWGLLSTLLIGYIFLFQFTCEYVETLLSSLFLTYFAFIYHYQPDTKLFIAYLCCLAMSNIYAFYKQEKRKHE